MNKYTFLNKRNKNLNLNHIYNKYIQVNDNIFVHSFDLNFYKSIDNIIKDNLKLSVQNHLEEYGNSFYTDFYLDEIPLYKNIKQIDLFNHWIKYYIKDKNKLQFFTIATPYLRNLSNEELIDHNIVNLIYLHFFKMYGYNNSFNINYNFYNFNDSNYRMKKYGKIKDPYEIIQQWVSNFKNSKEYLFYKNLLINENDYMLTLKEPIRLKTSKYQDYYTLIVPFFYDKTYSYLFENINNFKIINNESFSEKHIEKFLLKTPNWKFFLKQFIPFIEIPKLSIKRKKYKLKK